MDSLEKLTSYPVGCPVWFAWCCLVVVLRTFRVRWGGLQNILSLNARRGELLSQCQPISSLHVPFCFAWTFLAPLGFTWPVGHMFLFCPLGEQNWSYQIYITRKKGEVQAEGKKNKRSKQKAKVHLTRPGPWSKSRVIITSLNHEAWYKYITYISFHLLKPV